MTRFIMLRSFTQVMMKFRKIVIVRIVKADSRKYPTNASGI